MLLQPPRWGSGWSAVTSTGQSTAQLSWDHHSGLQWFCMCESVCEMKCVFMSDCTSMHVRLTDHIKGKYKRYRSYDVSINLVFSPRQEGREGGLWWQSWWNDGLQDALHQPLKMNNSDQQLLMKSLVLCRIMKVFHRLSSIWPVLVPLRMIPLFFCKYYLHMLWQLHMWEAVKQKICMSDLSAIHL